VFSGANISALIDGIAARGALARCNAVLSGYMGDAGIGTAIVDAVARVKDENPSAIYCCDPVLGDDDTGLYVRHGIDAFMRDVALPLADIATPNRFELEHLTGLPTGTMAEMRVAIATLQMMGPRIVLVTSVSTADTPAGCMDMLAAEDGQLHLLRTPALPVHVNGAGDAIAALFLFHRLRSGDSALALALAGSSIWGVLKRTADAGSREILTVAAQDEFISPSRMFDTIPC
jgi:pyridoxine kinase